MAEILTYEDRIEALESVKQRMEYYTNKTGMTPHQCIKDFAQSYYGWAGPGIPMVSCERKYIRVTSADRKRRGTIPWPEFWSYLERCENGQMSLFGEAV